MANIVKALSLNAYQELASKTAIYPGQGSFMGLCYCALKLNGEAGEVAEVVGKTWRDSNGEMKPEIRLALAMELGDVLWYIANLSKEIGYPLADIAVMNLEKLKSRKERGTLSGSGDNR
jgi:NTP pyrophosphatase (non-canonical NTP hydrolase)